MSTLTQATLQDGKNKLRILCQEHPDTKPKSLQTPADRTNRMPHEEEEEEQGRQLRKIPPITVGRLGDPFN